MPRNEEFDYLAEVIWEQGINDHGGNLTLFVVHPK